MIQKIDDVCGLASFPVKNRALRFVRPVHRGVPDTATWESWFMGQILNTRQHQYGKLMIA